MKLFYSVLLLLGMLFSCKQNHPDSAVEQPREYVKSSEQSVALPAAEPDYSKEFLADLKRMGNHDIRLNGAFLIYENDTVQFPDDMAKGRTYTFTSATDRFRYRLRATRVSYSTISYQFEVYKNDVKTHTDAGRAHLGMFFIAAEAEEDPATGDMVLADQYNTDNHLLTIKIARNEDGVLMAFIFSNAGRKPEGLADKVVLWQNGD